MKLPMVKLGDVCRVTPGFAFKSEEFASDGIPVVKIANIRDDYTVDLSDARCWPTQLFSDRLKKFVLKDKDILIAMTGATAGKLGRVRTTQDLLLNQRVAKIEAVDAEPDFIWFALSSERYRERFFSIAGGAAQPNMSGGQIEAVEIPLPPPPAQRKIADMLSAYDELLENNRRRMGLLEESARLLYREWFVRLRFPGGRAEAGAKADGHEHARITHGIPEGWGKCSISKFGEVVTGKTPSTKESDNYGGDIPFIKTPDMHGNVFVIATEVHLTEKGANTQPGKYIPPDTLLVSCIGTIGVVSLASDRSQFNQQINALIPSEECFRYFCYFAFKDLKGQMEALGGGATMANVNKTKFEGLEILKPTMPLLREFNEFCEPLFQQIKVLQLQNQKLRAARDLVLPRLMSGEIAL